MKGLGVVFFILAAICLIVGIYYGSQAGEFIGRYHDGFSLIGVAPFWGFALILASVGALFFAVSDILDNQFWTNCYLRDIRDRLGKMPQGITVRQDSGAQPSAPVKEPESAHYREEPGDNPDIPRMVGESDSHYWERVAHS